METSDYQKFKHLLESQLAELQKQANDSIVYLVESDTRSAEFVDMATLESDRAYTLRIRDRESRLIKKIKQSLSDIANGTYGICRECGEDIAIARLKARPIARMCIQCKTRLEKYESVAGF